MNIELENKTNKTVDTLIFNLLDIFNEIGIPVNLTARRLERMAKAVLAVGGIKKSFSECVSLKEGRYLKTREIIDFENEFFRERISPGSYDDIRRKDLLYPIESGIVISSSLAEKQATNSPVRGYGLDKNFSELLKTYGTSDWEKALVDYKEIQKNLAEELARIRESQKYIVKLPFGDEISLSYGEHNKLQKDIVEIFLAKFGFNSEVLYIGDAEEKFLFKNQEKLAKLGFFEIGHEKLPDIIAYSEEKNLLFLIEAVHSYGSIDEIRIRQLKNALNNCSAEIVFVTAFENRKSFKKWVLDIAWETEVWIAENPDHMIHFNGYKFLEIH